MNMRCSAGWDELNISAPDNITSACCYYSAEKEPWLDEITDLDFYWNGPSMKKLRAINSGQEFGGKNGCASCFYFANRAEGAAYYNFDAEPKDLSPAQRENLHL